MNVTRIGLDLATNVFALDGVDEHEQRVRSKTVGRGNLVETFTPLPPGVVGMEACGSAPYWAREWRRRGHEPRRMAPPFVAPYRQNDKNDRNDAAVIGAAAGRPHMRFVPIKAVEQQAVLTLHRARSLLVAERTALVNPIRGLLREDGLVLAQGVATVRVGLPAIRADADNGLPGLARAVCADRYTRRRSCDERVAVYDRRMAELARAREPARRLRPVEGVGPLTATAITATGGDARQLRNGRQFAAWLGRVARQRSSGGKARYGRITKRGDVYLRTLLMHGARALMRHRGGREDRKRRWAMAIGERRGFNQAAVAWAAKHARIRWAWLARGTDYQVAGA
jgi:transposase